MILLGYWYSISLDQNTQLLWYSVLAVADSLTVALVSYIFAYDWSRFRILNISELSKLLEKLLKLFMIKKKEYT